MKKPVRQVASYLAVSIVALAAIPVAGWIELGMWHNRGTPTGSFNGWGIFIFAPLAVIFCALMALSAVPWSIKQALRKKKDPA